MTRLRAAELTRGQRLVALYQSHGIQEERLEQLAHDQLVYHFSKPRPDGSFWR